jgi:hypothetical protein
MAAMDRAAALYEELTSRPRHSGLPEYAVLPDGLGLSIERIPDLVLAALGLETAAGRLRDVVAPPRADRILLIILDGLGYTRWADLAEQHSEIAALASGGLAIPITTVFPSTTVSALTTYSTGLPPGAHGMLGYRLFLREISATVNMIQLSVVGGRTEAPLPEAFLASSLLPVPTVYERLAADGVESHALLPRGIAASGLSQILYRGATQIHPGVNLSDMLVTARQILRAARSRVVVTLYWPGLDSVAHPRGAGSDAYVAEAASVAAAVRREIVGRVERTLLLVSSDHGFATMRPSDYVSAADIPGLRDALQFFPVGEPRASYLFLRPDSRDEAVARLHSLSDAGIAFIASREALAHGLFGSGAPHAETAARVGDLVAVSTGPRGLLHPYPDAPRLQGMHGGLTADEMIVPLIVSPL